MAFYPANLEETDPGFWSGFIHSISYHWKWGLSALSIFCATIYVSYMGLVAAAQKPMKEPSLEKTPLSSINLEAWAEAADALSEQRDQGKLRIPARNLIELIDWGRKNPRILGEALPGVDLSAFLSVTAALQHTRMNFRQLVEHDLRLDEAYGIMDEKEGDSSDHIPFSMPGPPAFKLWEKADLEVYKAHDRLVEITLYDLLPDMSPLVPAWEAAWEGQDGKSEDRIEAKPRCIAWRMVGGRGSGPTVIRKR